MDILEDEGLLEKGEAARLCRTAKEDRLDMLSVAESRNILLSHAFQNADASLKKEAEEFAASQSWINDFALFCAAKEHFNEKAWTDWEDKNLRAHTHESIEKYNELLSDRIAYHKFLQFLCFKQWAKLKTYVNSLGIRIIGDIPIYVSSDSADVWAHQDEFLLDKDGRPSLVAGVPPDYFSKDGQLWGNPLYNWDTMKANGYKWWILQFAFNNPSDHSFLPHMSETNSVYYTGTHDNDTLLGWLDSTDSQIYEYAKAYMGLNEDEGADWGMIRTAMSSRSDLAIFQMQDFLGLDTTARMNTPATLEGNWQWRMKKGADSPELARRIFSLSKMFDRTK